MEKYSSKQLIEIDSKYGAHNYHPLPVVSALKKVAIGK